MKVLIVDDNALTDEATGTILAAAGHEVVGAQSGAEALARRALWSPDVILLDLRLPDMGGLELLRLLRAAGASAGAPAVPVVIASAADAAEVEGSRALAEGAGLGPVLVLRKPFDPEDLLSLLRGLESPRG